MKIVKHLLLTAFIWFPLSVLFCVGCDHQSPTPPVPARYSVMSNGQHVAQIDSSRIMTWLDQHPLITIESITPLAGGVYGTTSAFIVVYH